MCLYGVYNYVDVVANQNNKRVMVDACIAEEIQSLNNSGIVTLGCCCGHGTAGQIIEWENEFGKWKGRADPPIALIDEHSVAGVKQLGYHPYPYYYADGESNMVWQMQLKTGCITQEDCLKWHEENGLLFQRELGIVIKRGAGAPLLV